MSDQMVAYCPNCGHEARAGGPYCESCGHALDQAAPEQPATQAEAPTSEYPAQAAAAAQPVAEQLQAAAQPLTPPAAEPPHTEPAAAAAKSPTPPAVEPPHTEPASATGTAPTGQPDKPARSRPAWLIPAIAGFAAVVVIVAVVLILVLGSKSSSSGSGDAAKYNAAIAAPMTGLNSATISISNGLASAGTASDLANVKTLAIQSLSDVSQAQSALAGVQPATSMQAAQAALIAAVSGERQYLSLLVRATSQPPATGQKSIPALISQATTVDADYGKFFQLDPSVQNVISSTSIGNLSGLDAAYAAALKQNAAQNQSANQGSGITVIGPGNGSSSGFISPAQTTQCETSGSSVICQSAAGTVAVDQNGPANQIGTQGMPSGLETLVYGRTWNYGSISCSIDFTAGTSCSNATGNGFTIRKQDLSTY